MVLSAQSCWLAVGFAVGLVSRVAVGAPAHAFCVKCSQDIQDRSRAVGAEVWGRLASC